MMLNLILCDDWVTGRDRILELIADDVRRKKGNRILMVPELISHDMERRLCASAGDTASRYAEVLSFTRLASRGADGAGASARECLDNGGRVVAMAAAARQLHSRLKAYAQLETRPEFLTGLVDAVDEFKRCCITAEDLKSASKQAQGGFAQKLEELALLLEAYDGLCSRGKKDPRDQMTWLLEQLYDSSFAQEHTFYIDGFPDFTRQHLAILEYVIQVSPQVTISMNCDCSGSSRVAFEKAGATTAELIRCAQNLGVPYEIQYLASPNHPLKQLRECLFEGATMHIPSLAERLSVSRTQSVYQACSAAANRIMELVRSGCRYRRIGVVCTDIAAYQHVLSLVFGRFGIPLYQSGTEDILQKTVIRTVLSSMDAALNGFDRQDTLRYLKSALSPVDMETCDEIENYTFTWGIQGNRWLQTWENHPDGLGAEWTEEAKEKLSHLNVTRQQALQPLCNLRDRFRQSIKLSQQVEAIYCFFEEINLAEQLSELADAMDASGDNRSAQILNQLWEILLSALEQLYSVLGETVWETDHFTKLFTLLLSQYDVGTIPPVLDAVTAGPISAMRCQEIDHLILLGAEEGLLPSYCGSRGVLTDQERNLLRQMGVPLTGGGMEGLQAEFSEIYGVFCGARETVTVFCGPSQPSFVYRRLCVMAGRETEIEGSAAGVDLLDTAAYLATHNARDVAVSLNIDEAYDTIIQKKNYVLGTVGTENIRKLYGKKLRLSASQVDKQAECRLSYFLRYGLRAKERKEATVDPAEFGTYVHAVLEHTARRVMEMGGFHKVPLDEVMSIAMDYSNSYISERFSQLDSERMAYLFKRNVQELAMVVEELWLELSNSAFTPAGFEVAFGEEAQMGAIEIQNAAMDAQLRGFVDRVDIWDNGYTKYFRVVDYKTGRKDFDYCDVYNGIGLQLLLYMFALEDKGDSLLGSGAKPAGVQYFPARVPYLSSSGRMNADEADAKRGKELKRKGLILSDSDVVNAMEPEGAPKRLSCKTGKDGTLSGDIADRDQFRMLKSYVFHVLQKLVSDIASGNIDPNPYCRGTSHDACTYCPYKAVCHFAVVAGRRNYKAMTAQRFWEEIGKEMNRHG